MKKIFIISSALLIVVLFFLGIYNFTFKDNVSEKIIQQQVVEEKILQKKPEKIAVVSDQAIVSPFFDKKNETITYYSANDGTVWQIKADGTEKKPIETSKLAGLKKVLWSPDGKKVLTMFEKEGQASFYEYDYETKQGTKLKNSIDNIAWDNTGVKIFYKYYDAVKKERSINSADPSGDNWQKLADVNFKYIYIEPIPSTSIVSFWNLPDATQESHLQIIGAMGGQLQTIFQGRYGGDYLWSPDGTQALVSSLKSNNEKTITLGLLSINSEYHDLGIPTMVSKCVWSSDSKTIYYALPGDIPSGAILPNDYVDKKFMTQDTFWKMDVATGKKERIIEATDISGKYDSTNLFLSAKNENLYFINRIDGKLYKIEM